MLLNNSAQGKFPIRTTDVNDTGRIPFSCVSFSCLLKIRFSYTPCGAFMDNYSISITVENALNYVLLWVGMSVVAGAFAKLLVPGQNPHGTLATFFLGFFGVIASALLLKLVYFKLWEIETFNPVQPTTLVVGIVLSAVGLYLYRGVTSSLTGKKA